MSVIWNCVKQFPLERTILALILLVVCLLVIKVLMLIVDRSLKRSKLNALTCKILRTVAKAFLLQLLCDHPMTLDGEGMSPTVHVKEYRDSDICFVARAWSENKNYWTVYFDVMDAVKPTLEKNGIEFSYPHVNVHMMTK